TYGAAWAWLPTPLWLTLVDPASDGAELARLARVWGTRRPATLNNSAHRASAGKRRSLPVIPAR
ncbi:MAG TPA: hypothetical protein VGB05_04490, partial [Pyrinomonadaceae bacterium]